VYDRGSSGLDAPHRAARRRTGPPRAANPNAPRRPRVGS